MSCVTIKTCVKPPEAMVWAFMVLRRLWPDACGCDPDGDPWSGLQRAYTRSPYNVFENVQALSLYLSGQIVRSLEVSWNDRLVVCGDQDILDRLVALPQWQHLVSSYPQEVKPEIRAIDQLVDQLLPEPTGRPSPDTEHEFPMLELQPANHVALDPVHAA